MTPTGALAGRADQALDPRLVGQSNPALRAQARTSARSKTQTIQGRIQL